jgi:hypothetical protein
MAIRNPKKEGLKRLENKTLDAQFRTAIREGLNCSPFEAEAVLGVVRELYFPFMGLSAGSAPPGKITLVAVCADEPAGKPIADCEKRTVCLTIHRGCEDDRLMQAKGPAAYRQARIPELCQEALSQGALLTREDLAYRVFFVHVRTISRDLEALCEADPETPIPLRSTVQDIGPVLTHQVQIVRQALEGHTTTEIGRRMRHSSPAIIDAYNNVRLHSALSFLRPVDYYRGDPEALLAERRRKLQTARELRKQENIKLRQRLLPFVEDQTVSYSEPAIVSL